MMATSRVYRCRIGTIMLLYMYRMKKIQIISIFVKEHIPVWETLANNILSVRKFTIFF